MRIIEQNEGIGYLNSIGMLRIEIKIMERETGFEPATSYLEGRHSATELLPHKPISF